MKTRYESTLPISHLKKHYAYTDSSTRKTAETVNALISRQDTETAFEFLRQATVIRLGTVPLSE